MSEMPLRVMHPEPCAHGCADLTIDVAVYEDDGSEDGGPAARSCAQCGRALRPAQYQWPRHRRAYCGPRCQRAARRARQMALQPTGDPALIVAEAMAAYEAMRDAKAPSDEGGGRD